MFSIKTQFQIYKGRPQTFLNWKRDLRDVKIFQNIVFFCSTFTELFSVSDIKKVYI